MNKLALVIILLVIVVISAGLYLKLNNNQPSEIAAPGQPTSSSTKSYNQIASEVNEDKAVILDVRTPEEYQAGHASDAINLSLQEIESGKMPEVPKDRQIYVYCRSGARAAVAQKLLQAAGFTNVTNLGGLSDIEGLGATL